MLSPQLLSILRRMFPPTARRPGPAGYTDAQIVACLVIGCRLQARSLRHLVRLLETSPPLVRALGLSRAPSAATLSRRLRRLAPQLGLLCRRLSRQVDPCWIGAMDATGLRTRSRGSRWGWSRPYGLFCGLKLHAVVTPSGLLRDFVLTPAAVRESRVFFRGTGLTVLLADRGGGRSRGARVGGRHAGSGHARASGGCRRLWSLGSSSSSGSRWRRRAGSARTLRATVSRSLRRWGWIRSSPGICARGGRRPPLASDHDSHPIPSPSRPSRRCGSGGRTRKFRYSMSPQSRSGGGGGMHTSGEVGSHFLELPEPLFVPPDDDPDDPSYGVVDPPSSRGPTTVGR